MDILLVILTAYFFGKQVEEKGYSSYRWRFRYVLNCIMAETLVAGLSLFLTNYNFTVAALSGMLALVGMVIFQWQKVREMQTVDREK